MQHNYWIYLLIMFAVTYLVRVLPLVVFKKKITNRFVRSFLTYIPYAGLAVDCIPAAATGVIAAVIVAFKGGSLFTVAASASVVVYVMLLIL